MKENFSIFHKNLVSEMSLMVKDIPINVEHYYKLWNANKSNAKLIDTINTNGIKLLVYNVQLNDYVQLFLFQEENLAIYLEFFLEEDGGIQMDFVGRIQSKGIFISDIYKNFLLKHFNYILSDDRHTRNGFNVYKMLADDPDIKFTVINNDTKEENIIDNMKDLIQYYGHVAKQKYIFRIELK